MCAYKDPKQGKEYNKKYREKNKKKLKEKRQKYLQKPEVKQRRKEYMKKYQENNKDRLSKEKKKYYENNNKKRVIETAMKKLQVYNHYSNYDIKCNCCGEREIEFLSLDHINNDGNKHRKNKRYGNLVIFLFRKHFPSGFQILCMNCNFAKGKNPDKICPHQIKKAEQILN